MYCNFHYPFPVVHILFIFYYIFFYTIHIVSSRLKNIIQLSKAKAFVDFFIIGFELRFKLPPFFIIQTNQITYLEKDVPPASFFYFTNSIIPVIYSVVCSFANSAPSFFASSIDDTFSLWTLTFNLLTAKCSLTYIRIALIPS